MIGLAGPGGVGKSTTAKAICARWNRGAHLPISFALKRMLEAYYLAVSDLPHSEIWERLDGELKREPCPYLGGKTPTYAMQTLGTEWGRDLIDPELWTKAWQRRAEMLIAEGVVPINDSVRFDNEAQMIRDAGGIVVRLYGRGDLASDHVSEQGDFWADLTMEVDAPPAVIAERILQHVRAMV